jgi:hypothetical protein
MLNPIDPHHWWHQGRWHVSASFCVRLLESSKVAASPKSWAKLKAARHDTRSARYMETSDGAHNANLKCNTQGIRALESLEGWNLIYIRDCAASAFCRFCHKTRADTWGAASWRNRSSLPLLARPGSTITAFPKSWSHYVVKQQESLRITRETHGHGTAQLLATSSASIELAAKK